MDDCCAAKGKESKEVARTYSHMVCEEAIDIMKSWKILAVNRRFVVFSEEIEKNQHAPFFFLLGSDIQFGLIRRLLERNQVPCWDREIELAELAVLKINMMKPKPRFFVVCGDMCDATPCDEPELQKKQEVDFKKIFHKLDPEIPLVCVCGNHDIGDHPTPDSIASYRRSFGDDFYSFWCGGIFFLVLNSQYFYDPSSVTSQAEEQDHWLNGMLLQARKSEKRVVVFQHIPLFLRKPDEVDLTEYYSIEPVLRKQLLDKMLHAGVKCIFSGHYHRNSSGSYNGMEMVVTSAMGGQLGFDKSGLRVVRCLRQEIHHTYYNLENLPRNIDL